MIVDADLSQLEWRVAAYLSQDPVMIEEIEKGVDIHLDNARRLFGDDEKRTLAKVASFRILYGGSAYAFHMDHRMPKLGIDRWEQIVEEFGRKYSKLIEWQNRNYQIVLKRGWLRNPTGRILTFQKVYKKGVWTYSRPSVCNFPVQSLATADIVPMVMVELKRRFNEHKLNGVKWINQVHDSIILDVPNDLVDDVCELCVSTFEDIPNIFHNTFGVPYNVPMTGECKYGYSWGSTVKWKKGEHSK